MMVAWRHDIQHNNTCHDDTKPINIAHIETRHKDTQHINAELVDIQLKQHSA
jgi:hypothetical protein